MSVISTDASHTTLTSAVSRLDIQSSDLDFIRPDTPFPQEKFSDETLDLLIKARDKLGHDSPKEQRPKGNKRPRRDISPSTPPSNKPSDAPERSDYPPESKSIYLRLKNNYRKKITFASQISQMHSELLKKRYPQTVEFKFNVNRNRDPKFRSTWIKIIDECKHKLTKAILDDMFDKYSNVKGSINQDLTELEKILTSTQLHEIKESLHKRSTGMAPVIAKKARRQYEVTQKPKGNFSKGPKRKFVPANRHNKPDNMQQFVQQLKKIVKIIDSKLILVKQFNILPDQ